MGGKARKCTSILLARRIGFGNSERVEAWVGGVEPGFRGARREGINETKLSVKKPRKAKLGSGYTDNNGEVKGRG